MAANDKDAVVRAFREIALLLALKGENVFKIRAYDRAADRVAGLPADLRALAADGRLVELPDIGAALAKKIAEILSTGGLEYLERLRAEFPPGILEVMRVPELGPKRTRALWKEAGVTDLASLEAACRAGRVRALKGFGPAAEERILAKVAALRSGQGPPEAGETPS